MTGRKAFSFGGVFIQINKTDCKLLASAPQRVREPVSQHLAKIVILFWIFGDYERKQVAQGYIIFYLLYLL